MDVVFARTSHSYDSYGDFWKLVELSGYPVVDVSGIELDADVTYVTTPMNAQLPEHVKSQAGRTRRCRIVWWNLEGHCAMNNGLSNVVDQAWPLVDACWVSDRALASMDPRATFVIVGSHPSLGTASGGLQKAYDFTHQSYEWGRRCALYEPLRRVLCEGPNAYGPERDRILRASKIMLNVHQYEHPIVPPLRFALAAAYALPLVSERTVDPFPYSDETVLFYDFYDLVIGAHEAVTQRTDLNERGARLHDLMCERWTFRRGVEAGIGSTKWKE